MATKTLAGLTPKSPLVGTDLIEVEDGVGNYRGTLADITLRAYAGIYMDTPATHGLTTSWAKVTIFDTDGAADGTAATAAAVSDKLTLASGLDGDYVLAFSASLIATVATLIELAIHWKGSITPVKASVLPASASDRVCIAASLPVALVGTGGDVELWGRAGAACDMQAKELLLSLDRRDGP